MEMDLPHPSLLDTLPSEMELNPYF
jgi:hypothetical protein